MSLASMTSDVHCARGLRCARCVFSDSIRTRALCHLRASFDLGVVLGRDPDTGTILGRYIAMFAPPSGELSPENEICVRMSPDNGTRIGKLLGSAARVRMSPDNAACVRMSPESGVPTRNPFKNEAFARIPLENPKAGETR